MSRKSPAVIPVEAVLRAPTNLGDNSLIAPIGTYMCALLIKNDNAELLNQIGHTHECACEAVHVLHVLEWSQVADLGDTLPLAISHAHVPLALTHVLQTNSAQGPSGDSPASLPLVEKGDVPPGKAGVSIDNPLRLNKNGRAHAHMAQEGQIPQATARARQ